MLGGCSLRGGEGSIIGVVLGTVLLQVLAEPRSTSLGIPSSLNFAVMGSVILLGVLADQQFLPVRRRGEGAAGGGGAGANRWGPLMGWRLVLGLSQARTASISVSRPRSEQVLLVVGVAMWVFSDVPPAPPVLDGRSLGLAGPGADPGDVRAAPVSAGGGGEAGGGARRAGRSLSPAARR